MRRAIKGTVFLKKGERPELAMNACLQHHITDGCPGRQQCDTFRQTSGSVVNCVKFNQSPSNPVALEVIDVRRLKAKVYKQNFIKIEAG